MMANNEFEQIREDGGDSAFFQDTLKGCNGWLRLCSLWMRSIAMNTNLLSDCVLLKEFAPWTWLSQFSLDAQEMRESPYLNLPVDEIRI
jgi:hypothetical protein